MCSVSALRCPVISRCTNVGLDETSIFLAGGLAFDSTHAIESLATPRTEKTTMKPVTILAQAVGAWLQYEFACARSTLFNEPYMSVPIAHALYSIFKAGGPLKPFFGLSRVVGRVELASCLAD